MMYWQCDPDGYLKHTLVGIIIACLTLYFKYSPIHAFLFTLQLAVLKECADWFVTERFSFYDILFTLIGVLPCLFKH